MQKETANKLRIYKSVDFSTNQDYVNFIREFAAFARTAASQFSINVQISGCTVAKYFTFIIPMILTYTQLQFLVRLAFATIYK